MSRQRLTFLHAPLPQPQRLFRRLWLIVLFLTMLSPSAEAGRPRYTAPDTIEFSGYRWAVKESMNKRVGPGSNLFSSSRKNVWVDAEGKLHLRVTQQDEKWYCPEIFMVNSLGYGRDTFLLSGLPQPEDKDLVIGMFLYDHLDSMNNHKEIDIEISRWGKSEGQNCQFLLQPYVEEAFRFDIDASRKNRHEIDVRKHTIRFRSLYQGDHGHKSVSLLARWKCKPSRVYETSNEKVSLNVWIYKSIEPANLKEFEVIVEKFEFKPFKAEKLKPNFKIPWFKKKQK